MTGVLSNIPVPPPPNRSYSSDHADRNGDKARKQNQSTKPPTRKPTHVDVIDQLDYSGIGAATFHHDGPFDACAPSRNKNKTKAPMYAFDGDVPLQQAEGTDKRLSPLAQATILAMKQNPGSSPYAVSGTINTNVQAQSRQPPSPTYVSSNKKKSPKKSALAEAWGIAEPEPFEEFSAGRQSGYERDSPMSGSLTSVNAAARTGMTTRVDPFSEYADGSRPQNTRRPSRALPPPQPIQLYPEFPEGEDPTPMSTAPSAYGARPMAPKRSKSLIQRFRKMRDSPNAPPQADFADEPVNPPTEVRLVSQRAPPAPERGPPEPYVMIDGPRNGREKNLPPMPPMPPPPSNADYFEAPHNGVAPNGGGGLGRKGSIMKKMKGVMSR
ncbi:Pal1-domain-containing protein [Ceratobasidium sp. AG-I]|nr:Pal1-domain-containing protein [Ceratobasidium sp. AG-I]